MAYWAANFVRSYTANKGRAGKSKAENSQEAVLVSCCIGLSEGEPVAALVRKSIFYAPKQANVIVQENAQIFFWISHIPRSLQHIFHERRMIRFLTIKSLTNIRSLDKPGRKSPFKVIKMLTWQVNRSASIFPKFCNIAYQPEIYIYI